MSLASTDNAIDALVATKTDDKQKRNDVSTDVKQTKEADENKVEPPRKVTRRCERDGKDERRMEINRLRAKQIRKRKKEMEEDMQKQIIQLTLENNKLRTQLKVQETEIALLRNQVSES